MVTGETLSVRGRVCDAALQSMAASWDETEVDETITVPGCVLVLSRTARARLLAALLTEWFDDQPAPLYAMVRWLRSHGIPATLYVVDTHPPPQDV